MDGGATAIVIVTIKQPVATIRAGRKERKSEGLYSITRSSLRTLGFNLFDWIACRAERRRRAIICRTAVVMA